MMVQVWPKHAAKVLKFIVYRHIGLVEKIGTICKFPEISREELKRIELWLEATGYIEGPLVDGRWKPTGLADQAMEAGILDGTEEPVQESVPREW